MFFKNYSCWRINTVKWRVGIQRAIDTTVSERDLFSRGKSLAREWSRGTYVILGGAILLFWAKLQYFLLLD